MMTNHFSTMQRLKWEAVSAKDFIRILYDLTYKLDIQGENELNHHTEQNTKDKKMATLMGHMVI